MNPIRCLLLLFVLTICHSGLMGQSIDQIWAVLDEEVILQSDIERQYDYYLKNGKKDDGTLKCTIFENLLSSKLLLAKAKIDSLTVSENQVEEELNQRVNSILRQLGGSTEELERIYGKTIIELKIELRPDIKDQMMVEEMKKKIFAKNEITPKEVKEYFNSIPKDSLPFLPAEVEMSHIVLKPKASEKAQQEAKEKLDKLRQRILNKEIKFEDAAALNSMDYASAKDGGSLGKFGKGQMVPEFEEVVYNMQVGQVSKVFQSPFGYHIIRLEGRNLDEIEARHILIRPEISSADEKICIEKLRRIRNAVKRDSIKFASAAELNSDDPYTKNNGGRVTAPGGDFRVPLDKLDADLYLKIDNMKEGEISEPLEMISTQGDFSKSWHIIWLQKRTAPHKANLKDDYQKFAQTAKQSKQNEILNNWFIKTKKQVFIEIKPNECAQSLQNWN